RGSQRWHNRRRDRRAADARTLPPAHTEPRRPGAEGPLPRQRARLLLELRQPAAAAADLRPGLRGDPARPPPAGDGAVPALLLLRDPALDLAAVLPHRGRGSADLGRQPHQEGALSRGDPARGDGPREPLPLRARPPGAPGRPAHLPPAGAG